jgi:hypothetical protein
MSNTSGFEAGTPANQPAPAAGQPGVAVFAPQNEQTNGDTSGSNESPFGTFVKNVRKCGREAALGRDSLPNLVGYIAEAVNSNALDPNEKFKGPDNKEINAAAFIFNVYTQEEGKKSVHERSKLSQRAQVSKLNKVIAASAKPNVNFRGTLAKALEMRKSMYDRLDKSTIKSAFDHYVSLSRAQLKKDADLTDAEIEKEGMRGEAEAPTVHKELKGVYKKLKKLLDTSKDVHIETEEVFYEDIVKMRDELLTIIRLEESDFDVPKEKKEGEKGAAGAASGTPSTGNIDPAVQAELDRRAAATAAAAGESQQGSAAFAMTPQPVEQPAAQPPTTPYPEPQGQTPSTDGKTPANEQTVASGFTPQ